MRKALMLVGIPVAVIGVAVAVGVGRHRKSDKSNDAFSEDLQRAQATGIELAQAQGASRYALTETAVQAKPLPAKAIKQGPGAKAVRSATPTVNAAPEPVAALVVEALPDIQVMQTTATPTPAEVIAPAIPRPVPRTMPSPESDQGPILTGGSGRGTGNTDTGGGIGLGGIFVAIIRGGTVDGDNCDPRGARPRTNVPPPMRAPVYAPNPSGMNGGRLPTIRSGLPLIGSVIARPRGH